MKKLTAEIALLANKVEDTLMMDESYILLNFNNKDRRIQKLACQNCETAIEVFQKVNTKEVI